MITVSMKGLKAREQTVALNALNLHYGPNESGKSSINEALRILALGNVPALGRGRKNLQALAPLLNGRELLVEATLADGRTFTRQIVNNGRGLSSDVSCSWLDAKAKQDDHHAAILSLFSAKGDERDVEEAVDIRSILNASPNERAARIEPLAAMGSQTPEEKLNTFRMLLLSRLTGRPLDQLPPVWTEGAKLLKLPQTAALRDVWPGLKAQFLAQPLPSVLAWANEKKRAANQSLQKKTQARKELEARVGSLPKESVAECERLEAERSRLEREFGALAERTAEAEKRLGPRLDAQQQLRVARQRLAAADESVAALELRDRAGIIPPTEDELATMRILLDTRCDQLADLVVPMAPNSTDLEEMNFQADRLRRDADAIVLPPALDYIDEERAVLVLEKQHAEMLGSAWRIVRQQAEILADKAGNLKSALAEVARVASAELMEVADQHSVAPALLTAELKTARRLLEEVQAAFHEREEERARLDADCISLREKAQRLRQEAAQQHQERQEAYQEAREEYVSLQGNLTLAVQELEAALRAASTPAVEDQEAVDATVEWASARDALAAAEQRIQDLGDTPGEEPVFDRGLAEKQALEVHLTTVTGQLQQHIDAAAMRTQLQSIIEEIQALSVLRDVLTAIEDALQGLRAQEINESGGALRQHMQTFIDGTGLKRTPYIRAKAGAFELGWIKEDGTEVAAQVQSGGEWILFTAALATAVIALRGGPLKVLLVEAAEAAPSHLQYLLRGIQTAVAHQLLTCAIVSTWYQPEPSLVPEGWRVRQFPLTGKEPSNGAD